MPKAVHAVDTFYLYPTTYIDPSPDAPDICDISNPMMRSGARDKLIGQASVFSGSTNVFAPFYRQTNLFKVERLGHDEIYGFQHGLQREDVFAALDHYFEHLNGGRPFILAGHSQGSIMTGMALDEYMDTHREEYSRMVAAYVIGFSVTRRFMSANPHLKFAEREDDTGVVVSWNTEGPENIGRDNVVIRDGALCINPLNWRCDETYAPVGENLGSLVKRGECEFEHVPGLGDARVDTDRGSLICTTAPEFYIDMKQTSLFGPASLHNMDYGLYYDNLARNVRVRSEAYLSDRRPWPHIMCAPSIQHPSPGPAPPRNGPAHGGGIRRRHAEHRHTETEAQNRGMKVGPPRFELELRAPQARRIPSYPTGPLKGWNGF